MLAFPFNVTQEAQIMDLVAESTVASTVPLLLLESFMLGTLSACAPLGTYWYCAKPPSSLRAPSISILWIFFTAAVTHWVLSLLQLEATLNGSSLGLSVSLIDLTMQVTSKSDTNGTWFYPSNILAYDKFIVYGQAWRILLTVVTETVLLGFGSFLFVCTAVAIFWRIRSNQHSRPGLILPIIASAMYTLSLVHWALSLRLFKEQTDSDPDDIVYTLNEPSLTVPILVSFSINAIMSDSVVLWRMCVVWGKARCVISFAAVLLAVTLALNIANVIESAGESILPDDPGSNDLDSELLLTAYAGSQIGLATAFVSLASNLCATVLVGVKTFMHRKQFPKHFRSEYGRTFVESVLELLVESGIVYSAIWLLYCISFLQPITDYDVYLQTALFDITATGHLDAAMAQITSIYPLMVFLLLALGKIHHSLGPRSLRQEEAAHGPAMRPADATTFEIVIERSMGRSPELALSNNGLQLAVEDGKVHDNRIP